MKTPEECLNTTVVKVYDIVQAVGSSLTRLSLTRATHASRNLKYDVKPECIDRSIVSLKDGNRASKTLLMWEYLFKDHIKSTNALKEESDNRDEFLVYKSQDVLECSYFIYLLERAIQTIVYEDDFFIDEYHNDAVTLLAKILKETYIELVHESRAKLPYVLTDKLDFTNANKLIRHVVQLISLAKKKEQRKD